MPNLLLTGPTNNGKSMIIEKFRRSHPPVSHPDREEIPVLVVQMPSDPSVGRFYTALLAATGAPLPARQYRLADLEQLALRVLRAAGVRVLVIDELHNVLSGRGDRRREFLNLLRFLGNELRIPLVGVGTREAYLAIRSDDQLENRFAPFTLPRWEAGADACSLLASFAASFPLRRPSRIATTEMAAYLLTRSEGTIGELAAPAHRRGRRRDRVWRGGHQPAHLAARPVRRANRAAAAVRARAGVSPPAAVAAAPAAGPAASRCRHGWRASPALYSLTVSDLLTRNLGQPGAAVAPERIDFDPPAAMLAALAERTGTETRAAARDDDRRVGSLADGHAAPRGTAQETFDTYVRQDSVLLAPGEAGHHLVTGRRRWAGPWWPARPVRRVCPACAEDADPRRALAWELPLTASCHEHGCRLEDSREVAVAAAYGERPRPVPVPAALATLDRYTYEALITGRVTLPGRAVHAGVWFRLLRSLLDEASLAGSTVGVHGRATLERIWEATGLPARGGLSIWRPYEQMDWPLQEAMLHAAAAALQLAADGQITARGVFGPAVQPAPHRHVYDGDRPSSPRPSAWDELMAAVSDAVALARTDGNAARQLLALLTIGCRTLDRFEEKRSYLSGIGIPAGFLPSAREIGRDDLA